jgi:hypothetical protein
MSPVYGLQDFVDEVRHVVSRRLRVPETLQTLTPSFRRLLTNRTFLREKLATLESVDDEVCLYHDPDYHFVVLARGASSRPAHKGQSHAAMPHDHGPLWALYGLYEGSARLQRYVPDSTQDRGPFPGLRLVSEVGSTAGAIDAIALHSMHLPVFAQHGANVIIVVYSGPLTSVVRRGYVPGRRSVVEFEGLYPPNC